MFFNLKCVFGGLAVISAGMLFAGNDSGKENIIDPRLFNKNLSFIGRNTLWEPWRNQKFKTENGVLSIKSDGKTFLLARTPSLRDFMTAESLNVSMEYRSSGKSGIRLSFTRLDRPMPYQAWIELSPTGDVWKKWSGKLSVLSDAEETTLNFQTNSMLEIRNLEITENEPLPVGDPLLLDGAEPSAIVYSESTPQETFADSQAAHMLRYCLVKNGKRGIPVIRLKKNAALPANAIYIGNAAKASDILNTREIASIQEGGYFMRQVGKSLAIAGARPSGSALGVLHFLRRIGIRYLGTMQFAPLKAGALNSAPFTAYLNPAVPYRGLNDRIPMAELYGASSIHDSGDFRMLDTGRNACHSMIYLLPYTELKEKHPEFFAIDAKGSRVQKKTEEQYCLSQPSLIEETASRLMEMMKADPKAKYYWLFPGDGGNRVCVCENCVKFGKNYTDRLLFFVNSVAEKIAPVFPENYLMTLAYVDSFSPPEKYFPAKNVIVNYCPYIRADWPSMLYYEHKANEPGKKFLTAWEKSCGKNLGGFFYPCSARERQSIWPAFYANLQLYKRAAAHKNRVQSMLCGWYPAYGAGTVPQGGSFTDFNLVFFNELLCNPGIDVEKTICQYMDDAYGPAAKEMYEYFELINREPAKRNWVQHCEIPVRGFVTESLADKALTLLDRAEKSAGADPRIRRNILKEKAAMFYSYLYDNNRGRGNISKSSFPKYAARLGEFCRIEKETGLSYMQPNPKEWFWECHLIEISGKGKWYDEKVISDLMKNPVTVLGASIPIIQRPIKGGFRIPFEGLTGGQSSNSSWLRMNRVKCKIARRPSSGNGTIGAVFRLDKVPDKGLRLVLNGIDNEKTEEAFLKITLNGKVVHDGKIRLPKNAWGTAEFKLPADVLCIGENELRIMNTTPDKEAALDAEGGERFMAPRDYTWGWFMIEAIDILEGTAE